MYGLCEFSGVGNKKAGEGSSSQNFLREAKPPKRPVWLILINQVNVNVLDVLVPITLL